MPKLLPRSHLAQSFVSTFLGPKTQKCLPRGAKTTKFSHLRMHQRQTDQCELITRRSQDLLACLLVFVGVQKNLEEQDRIKVGDEVYQSWHYHSTLVNEGRNY